MRTLPGKHGHCLGEATNGGRGGLQKPRKTMAAKTARSRPGHRLPPGPPVPVCTAAAWCPRLCWTRLSWWPGAGSGGSAGVGALGHPLQTLCPFRSIMTLAFGMLPRGMPLWGFRSWTVPPGGHWAWCPEGRPSPPSTLLSDRGKPPRISARGGSHAGGQLGLLSPTTWKQATPATASGPAGGKAQSFHGAFPPVSILGPPREGGPRHPAVWIQELPGGVTVCSTPGQGSAHSPRPLRSPHKPPRVAWELPASFHPQLPQEPEQRAISWPSRAFPPLPPSCPGCGAHTSQTCL